jgi:peptide/nickel transport system substrate-binding protein
MDSFKRSSRIDRALGYIERLSDSDSLILKVLAAVVFVSLLWALVSLSLGWRTEVPVHGGTYREGIVGTPRFVNPILAVTRADKDLSALLFDGLMSLGKDGVLIPNIAESVTVSEDGLTYNVILRRDVTFHDGKPLTALDVVFTVNSIKEPTLTSPLRPNFDGVTVEQVGDYELNFILPEPYTPFMENLTFGILPEHIWGSVTNEEFPFSQRNSEPIGSGPYAINRIVRSPSGIPETYVLEAFEGYHRGIPKIKTFTLSFFSNEDKLIGAFKEKLIDGIAGIDPSRLYELNVDATTHTIHKVPLPRTFAIFFNQSKSPSLRDKGAREALSVAIDREELTKSVLSGYGIPLASPIPDGFGISIDPGTPITGDRSEMARDILRNSGWKLNSERGVWEKNINDELTTLELSIATVNNPVFEATAEYVRMSWERIGVVVTVKQFEQSDLTQGVIRPRDYEALLFGTHLGRSLDFYSFWHSSQRNDPGLNVALYTNLTTDEILTEARTTTDLTQRNNALIRFAEEIKKETPALFLYEPELLYVFPNGVTGASFTGVAEAHERFASVHDWYVDTESIWSFIVSRTSP